MPTGRLILRAYIPYRDTQWRQEWTENASGDLLAMTSTIVDSLGKAAPVIANEIKAAERRTDEEQKRSEER